MGDNVKHPEHYNDGKIEVWDFIKDKKLGFNTGNAIKYICRAGKKDPTKTVEDLKKAVEYLNKEIEIKGGKIVENEDNADFFRIGEILFYRTNKSFRDLDINDWRKIATELGLDFDGDFVKVVDYGWIFVFVPYDNCFNDKLFSDRNFFKVAFSCKSELYVNVIEILGFSKDVPDPTYTGFTPKNSGRYPWGENDPKEAKRWLDNVNTLICNGWSGVDIAKVHGLTTIGFRDRIHKYREVINQHDKDVAVKNNLLICTEQDDYFMWNTLRWSTIFAYYKLPILPPCKFFVTFIGHKEYIVSDKDYSDEFYNKTIVLNVNFDNGTFTLEDDPYKTHFDIPKFALPECKYKKLVELLHDQNVLDHVNHLTVGDILDIIDFCNTFDRLRSDKFTDTHIANIMGLNSVILLRSMMDKCSKIKREVRKLL